MIANKHGLFATCLDQELMKPLSDMSDMLKNSGCSTLPITYGQLNEYCRQIVFHNYCLCCPGEYNQGNLIHNRAVEIDQLSSQATPCADSECSETNFTGGLASLECQTLNIGQSGTLKSNIRLSSMPKSYIKNVVYNNAEVISHRKQFCTCTNELNAQPLPLPKLFQMPSFVQESRSELYRGHASINYMNVYNSPHSFEDNKDGDEEYLSHSQELKFTLRRDVIKKTILRSFKKYFIDQFKSYYNYTKRIRRKGFNISAKTFLEAKQFIIREFPHMSKLQDMHIYLVAIVDTKKKFSHPNPVFSDTRSSMLEMLKLFNCEKFDNFLKRPQFAALFLKFLESPINEICRGKQELRVVQAYQKQIEMIRKECLSVVTAL